MTYTIEEALAWGATVEELMEMVGINPDELHEE